MALAAARPCPVCSKSNKFDVAACTRPGQPSLTRGVPFLSDPPHCLSVCVVSCLTHATSRRRTPFTLEGLRILPSPQAQPPGRMHGLGLVVLTNETHRRCVHERKVSVMSTMLQVYASELSKFTYADKAQTTLVAGEDIKGVTVTEMSADVDPASLVGAQASADPEAVKPGSQWLFRNEKPIVESERGGLFAFLIPKL